MSTYVFIIPPVPVRNVSTRAGCLMLSYTSVMQLTFRDIYLYMAKVCY